jgi:hypothetical protein
MGVAAPFVLLTGRAFAAEPKTVVVQLTNEQLAQIKSKNVAVSVTPTTQQKTLIAPKLGKSVESVGTILVDAKHLSGAYVGLGLDAKGNIVSIVWHNEV